MKELVIGAGGFIGGELLKLLPDAESTTRKTFDLLDIRRIPDCDIVYLCAGANGAKLCEGNQDAFRANVDSPIEIARRVDFMVFISSMSVEWGNTAYSRQKLVAETVLRTMPNVGIVRAGRVTRENVGDLCKTIIRVGRERIRDVTRWGSDDNAYSKA